MVQQFHDSMQARVQNDGQFCEPFMLLCYGTNTVQHNVFCHAHVF